MSEIGYYLQNGVSPEIFSVDRSKKRLLTLKRDISRLKLENITVINSKIQTLGEKNPELLDAIDFCVLDPPCSALGTRPKLIIEKSHEDFRNFFLLQRAFLKHIDRFIKPGGYLLYNTCSLTLLENEGIVFYALDRLGYKLISVRKILENVFPGRFLNGHPNSRRKTDKFTGKELNGGISIDESILNDLLESQEKTNETTELIFKNIKDIQKYARLDDAKCKKVVRTYPGPNTNGYFFALMQKP
jgi:16S rRNA C967 or C1407 C5-methylase (RsmB/RsmF family)